MREYVFSFEYDEGVHPVRDVFIDHPGLRATALAISASPNAGWRVERITGPEHALDTLETVYFDPDICNECVYPHSTCDAQTEYEVLEREPTARTIYHSTNEETFCFSVSSLAFETLGHGLVFDATQWGRYYEWRVLVPTGRDIGSFHEAVRNDLPEGVALDVLRVGTPDRWRSSRLDHTLDLSYVQREALETGMRLGYYEHPRDATLEDIAAELDLPLTTLRYRLRRAEAWAVTIADQLSRPGTVSAANEREIDGPTALRGPD